MEAIFLKLVNMSITASWLVLAVIAVRFLFQKAPKWILCLLWGLVAVRLICPFSIESSMSLIPDPEPLQQEQAYTAETVKQAHGEILDSEGNVILERHPAANGDILDSEGNVLVEIRDGIRTYPDKENAHGWMNFLSWIWAVGFGGMLAYTAVSYYLLKRKVATAIPLKRGIRQSEYVDSPFVLGILRPVIYLPFDMAEEDLAYVLAHEKAHIRRADHWWKPLGFGLLSVYWFNPVLWVAYILLCRDIEAACDEKVIKDMGKDERRAYSTALLNCSIHRRRIAACPLAFGEVGVKTRVKNVMNYRKPAFWVILIALVVGILAAVCFLTNPKSEEEDTSGYELIGSVTSQNGYTILNQEHTKINLVIEKEKLPEDCFTLKGHTFEAKEVIPYQTFADNVLYLKHVGIDEERSEYLRFNFSFQTDALEEGNLLLPYHMDDAGNGFVCNVEVNRGEVWDNQKTYENAAYFAPNIMGEGFCVLVKKSVCESAGHHIAFMLNDMNRLTYEVREEISPVTISLENVRPTGATILFHQDQDLISGSLICDYAYFLQQLTDGQWIDLPKLAEIPFPDQTYDIALLHHNGVNWEQMYGRLPVGSYRLGKVIPITSGDEPEYTTVYAEFTIDHVYTWFDDYSNNREEQYPKDNLVELFGMAGGSLSYHSDENTVYLIDAEGRNPIISCELRIRNIFLTDITGDSVAEVCATVQMKDGMHVQVYDATKKKLYQLPNGENWDCILTKKADRLCVRKQDDNGINIEYGQLSLDAEEGLQIHELDPEVLALSKNIVCVDVMNGKQVCLSSFSQIEQARSLLRDLEHQVHPATREEAETARKDPFDYCTITVNYELGEKQIVFSENFDFVWEYGSAETYRLSAPEPVRQLVGSVTNGIRMKETSGEPFATADAPWDWFAGVNMDAISTAQIYVCLDVTSTGNSTRVSGTNGIMPADSLQKLVNVLNQIPRDAFAADRMLTGQSAGYFRNTQQEVNCAVIMIDTVNHIAVMIRTSKGNVELLLTSELDKVLNDDHRYLEPTQIWTVRDQNLLSLLKDFCEDPPVITYFVGAEYQWQDPVTLTMDGFHMDLRLIEGWEYEYVTNAAGSGIRCRPAAVAEGWIYFSFWPEGYLAEEADRYLAEGYRNGFPSNISYPASVKSNNGVDTRHAVWSYEAVITDIGDFAIINDGADSWFLEYEDQIQDIISYVDFTVE